MESLPTSNQAFRALWSVLCAADGSCGRLTSKYAELQERVALVGYQLERSIRERAQLLVQLDELRPRLAWSPNLPMEVRVSMAGQLAAFPRARLAMVCMEFRRVMNNVRVLFPFPTLNRFVMLGAAISDHTFLMCTSSGVFPWDRNYSLGDEPLSEFQMPLAIAEPKNQGVIGVAAGKKHSVVCTAEGRLYTFGDRVLGFVMLT